ncbi:MAG TPA: prephenate dehydrogenase/arogenate dehydrogenase family protein [Nitrososphaerales archaeon]|nr:prephenate dehydrogenase/arogenate dehydrogenase family protein [Nitrososphaerales archaeon]
MNAKRARKSSSENELGVLRNQIQDVTKSILKLAKARQSLSERVALIKKSKQIPIENRRVESLLAYSMEEYAKSIDLDQQLVNRVTKSLIESSKSAQRRVVFQKRIRDHLHSQGIHRVGVVGVGRMGSWFANYFKQFAQVSLYDSDSKLARRRARVLQCDFAASLDEIAESDLIVVAVPISETSKTVSKLGKINSKAKLIEISSLKERVLSKVSKNRLFSIHPLFGSSADQFGRNSIIVINDGFRFVKGFFPHFLVFTLSAREHDKLMACLLSLPHILALVFADVSSKRKLQSRLSTPSFDAFLEIARKTLSENPQVYHEIQSHNKYDFGMLREIQDSSKRLATLLSRGHYTEFEKFFFNTRKSLKTKT